MTGMGNMKGMWHISDEKYPQFLDLLHDYLFVKRGRPQNFVETPRKNEPKPLLVDLDFCYPDDTSLRRAFTLDMIENFIHKIGEGLDFFFGLESYNELRFFVTLRPSPYSDKGKRKDGVHILCPDIALTIEKQSVLRKWLLNQEAVKTCFKDTGYTNPDDKIYDESMTKEKQQGWIFYGESKPNIPPYSLVAVFNYKPAENDWIDEDVNIYSTRDLMELLSVRYNIVPDENILKEGEPTEVYMNLQQKPVVIQPAQPTPEGETNVTNNFTAAMEHFVSKPSSEEERAMIRRFVLECLAETWHDDYDKWRRVGWCLHNIDPSEENFTLWMDFSAKSGKFSESDVPKYRHDWFHGMNKTGDGPRLTERSLRKWAKDDSPKLYNEIISENIHEYIRTQVEPTHFHISKLMKKMYGNNYVASVNPKTTEWFKYDEEINMWKRINQGMELKTKISCDVAGELETARGKIRKLAAAAKKQEERDWLDAKLKELLKVETKLYDNGFTESVMKMAAQRFCEEDFMNKLNANPFLLGCRNGILELRAKDAQCNEHVIFRQGRPEDYVSFLVGHNYPDSEPINYVPYNAADPIQADIADFFAKIFPNPELRKYTLRLLASCLEGANREQCYYTFTGVGGNGKSKLVELMRLTLGDYQTSMASTVMTRKRPESGAANPEIMVTKCRRFIYMQEPDDKEPINTSVMKQFSGEDIVEARQLFGEQEKFRIMGKICMMCNSLPPVSSMDQGTWRRIRVVPFESKFLSDDNPELLLKKPNVFPRDPKLDEKLRIWREPFLSLLVHIYETEYIPFGLNPTPDIVMKASSKYKESFDIYARFKNERMREPTTPEEQLEFRENPLESKRVRLVVNQWKKENRITNLTAEMVLSRMGDEYGEPEDGKFWPSLRIFASDEDVAEWDRAHAKP
jgi:P4 family phage/plasmid primase-like protien